MYISNLPSCYKYYSAVVALIDFYRLACEPGSIAFGKFRSSFVFSLHFQLLIFMDSSIQNWLNSYYIMLNVLSQGVGLFPELFSSTVTHRPFRTSEVDLLDNSLVQQILLQVGYEFFWEPYIKIIENEFR